MERLNKMVLKEFQKTNLQSFSDGQITINFPNEEELTNVDVVLTPTDGLYKGGRFAFRVCLPRDYPESVASITCRTIIFHPNINYEGNICFNILSDEWNRDVRLVDYAHALLWLLYQPNLDSRLNGDCPQTKDEFRRLVRASLQGKTVAGRQYPKMIEGEVVKPFVRPAVHDMVRQLNAPYADHPHRFVPPPADAAIPRRAPRAWPAVSSGVRFVNGIRAY